MAGTVTLYYEGKEPLKKNVQDPYGFWKRRYLLVPVNGGGAYSLEVEYESGKVLTFDRLKNPIFFPDRYTPGGDWQQASGIVHQDGRCEVWGGTRPALLERLSKETGLRVRSWEKEELQWPGGCREIEGEWSAEAFISAMIREKKVTQVTYDSSPCPDTGGRVFHHTLSALISGEPWRYLGEETSYKWVVFLERYARDGVPGPAKIVDQEVYEMVLCDLGEEDARF